VVLPKMPPDNYKQRQTVANMLQSTVPIQEVGYFKSTAGDNRLSEPEVTL